MNARERFHAIMGFDTSAATLKWEFGYWGGTVKRWYREGLAENARPDPRRPLSTPTSTLYTPAWVSLGEGRLPDGIAVMAGGLYYPTQGFPLDHDVRQALGMDPCQQVVDVNLLFHPCFEPRFLSEDEHFLDYIDVDGVQRRFAKEEGTIPTSMKWPIASREDWQRLKEERLNLDDLKGRFPPDWEDQVGAHAARDYPLALGGYPAGFFGTVSHLIGYENVFMWYYTEPDLMHDILDTFTRVWIAVFEEVLARVEVDHWQIWEDISFGKGSMVSPAVVSEFMVPYIRRVADFLRAHGVRHVLLDTDGDCNDLIPLFREAGVTGMYPFEVHCGMDVTRVRREHPELVILGGLCKSEIARGRAAIDAMLEPVPDMLARGGFIPFGDHFIPPDVSWEDFAYYRGRLNEMIDRAAGA